MASCPPAFAPDGSAIYSATGDSIIALSPVTLALLKVVPTHKRRIVQLLFLRASDSQLLILSKHRFSIYNTRTGTSRLKSPYQRTRGPKRLRTDPFCSTSQNLLRVHSVMDLISLSSYWKPKQRRTEPIFSSCTVSRLQPTTRVRPSLTYLM